MNPGNYVEFNHGLIKMMEDFSKNQLEYYFNMDDARINRCGQYYRMRVPALADGWTWLSVGGKLYVRRQGPGYSPEIGCTIQSIQRQEIIIESSRWIPNQDLRDCEFGVSFIRSSITFDRERAAVKSISERGDFEQIIFPEPEIGLLLRAPLIKMTERSAEELQCFNGLMNNDLNQKRAIFNILQSTCRPAPYLLLGPPGTGKTSTLIESILQVCRRSSEEVKILVCARSNNRVNHLTRLILKSGLAEGELIRYVTANSSPPQDLVNVTKFSIQKEEFQKLRVLVTTCVRAWMLGTQHFEYVRRRFQYFFTDQANDLAESQTVVPMSLMRIEADVDLDSNCRCILVGDPLGLTPNNSSEANEQHGDWDSMLVRLSNRQVYKRQNGIYDDRYVTRLRVNHRSDARLLEISNEITYADEPMGSSGSIETPEWLMQAIGATYPLVIHAIRGPCLGHRSSHWGNPNEAAVCVEYVRKLYAVGLKPSEIGIFSPFSRQRQKLEQLFAEWPIRSCSVGDVKYFKGLERKVMIVSTVRADLREPRSDVLRSLQIDERCFNMIMSRAQWMVIVVGNAEVMERDLFWAKYQQRAEWLPQTH